MDISIFTWRLLGQFVLIVVLIGITIRWWFVKRASKNWPTVTGKIGNGWSRRYDSGSVSHWYAEFTYSFHTLGGDYYGGTASFPMPSESAADEFARAKKGSDVTVRYNPKDPDHSTVSFPDASSEGGPAVR